MTSPLSEAQISAIKGMELKDSGDDDVTVQSVERLSIDRHTIYAAAGIPDFPAPEDSDKSVASVHCSNDDGVMEHIVVVGNAEPISAEAVIFEDKIMYDEVPLSEIVEYRFSKDAKWMLGSISQESLEFYRSSKFQLWKEMLMTGGAGCKRTFKSMLKNGLVTKIYDHISFPSPAEEAKDWEVIDENTGKPQAIPRPVLEIRVWDPEAKAYESLPARMEGAPPESEETEFWSKTLKELKELHGADVVEELLNA